MINETKKTLFVVKVNGQEVSGRVESRIIAEMEVQKLEESSRAIATIEQVTETGEQVLFG